MVYPNRNPNSTIEYCIDLMSFSFQRKSWQKGGSVFRIKKFQLALVPPCPIYIRSNMDRIRKSAVNLSCFSYGIRRAARATWWLGGPALPARSASPSSSCPTTWGTISMWIYSPPSSPASTKRPTGMSRSVQDFVYIFCRQYRYRY